MHILNAKAQLGAEATPLSIAKLAGRLEYARFADGFSVGSKKLEFRTKEGVVSPPADFSLSIRNAGSTDNTKLEKGEITANGIDLKVVTSLMEYFPIGKDVRQVVAKFGLRGSVKDSRFAWTGKLEKPSSYQIKGTLADFASLANEKIPGVTGFSGAIDGTEKGGTFNVNAKVLTFDVPNIFRETLRFDRVEGKGKWATTANDIVVDIGRIAFGNNDLNGEFAGKYTRLRAKAGVELAKEDMPGTLDIAGKFTNIRATQVAGYLPNGLDITRDIYRTGRTQWLNRNCRFRN